MKQEELLPHLLRKDERAFALLYENYSKSLYAIIFNLINDKEEAEDILQEVFIKIWNSLDSYNESKGRLYTWMLNITRNATIDKLRSKGFNNQKKNLSVDNFVHMMESQSLRIIDKLDVIGIKKFIQKLKPRCIELIELLFFQEYTQQEVSDELEIPLGTVKTQSRNCINELRNIVNE